MTQAPTLNIPNSAGNIYRQAVNDALAAISTHHAGPNPPGSPDSGTMWLDTNTPTATLWTMNIYTGASWLPVYYVDAQTGAVYPVAGIPVGASLDWNADVLPPGYLFEYGQAISRTAYSLLFARIGTNFGTGDGTSTFNLPDSRDRATIGKGSMGGVDAGRVTLALSGFDATRLGATGGSQIMTNVPSHTHGVNDPGHTHLAPGGRIANILSGPDTVFSYADGSTISPNTAGSGTNLAVMAAGITWPSQMNPVIVKNKIIFTGVFA